jgi:predicted XRE-type DNA-binding protein
VIADVGHPRPAEALPKAELARKIGAIIERRGLTQAAAAELLEVDQPKISV